MQTVPYLETLEKQVQTALQADDLAQVRTLLEQEHPADVADVLDRLDPRSQIRVFRLLPPEQAAEVLSETSVAATRALVRQLSPTETHDIFHHISLDDMVEILSEDVPGYQQAILAALEPEEARGAQRLLAYPPRTAGRLMSDRFVRVRPDMTAQEALDVLRNVNDDIESITDLFVVDEVGKLVGVVALRRLLAANPQQRLREIAETRPITTMPRTDQEEVARLVSQYDLYMLPVVAQDGRMLGIITVDDVVDVLVQEATEDVLRFGSVADGATDETYFSTPIWKAIQRRIGWLLLLFFTGGLNETVMVSFEEVLAQVVALSFFIPLLTGTGGNTGSQTVSTIIRALALGEVKLSDVWRVILRELGSGLLLGLLLSFVAFGMAFIMVGQPETALVVSLSVIVICVWSNVIGAIVPLTAQRFKLDPALVSAPLISTLVDATGLAIYLSIARLILGV